MSDDTRHLENIELTRNAQEQLDFYTSLNEFIRDSDETPLERMGTFAAYTPRQVITSFIERYELFGMVRNVPGSILECGVAGGQGLMSFAHLCSIFEPYHYVR